MMPDLVSWVIIYVTTQAFAAEQMQDWGEGETGICTNYSYCNEHYVKGLNNLIIIIIIIQEKINVAFNPKWTSRTRYNVKKLT